MACTLKCLAHSPAGVEDGEPEGTITIHQHQQAQPNTELGLNCLFYTATLCVPLGNPIIMYTA